MGGPPFKEYTFLFHIDPAADVGGGGMEHANSTAIAGASPEEAAAIAAHEFFHAWNVKRIRPQALEPVDYTKEQIYPRAVVRGGSDQHVRGIHARAHRNFSPLRTSSDLRPFLADHRARIAPRAFVAKCGGRKSGNVVRQI